MKIFSRKYITFALIMIVCFFSGAFTYQWMADKLSLEDIRAATKVIGVEMTDKEIIGVKEGVERNLAHYEDFRATPIPNSVVPSLVFNPLPPGFSVEKEQKKIRFSKLKGVKMPSNKEDLAFFTVRELAELIRTRQITSVELTQFFIARLKKHDEQLKCVVTLTEDRAMKMAQQADREIAAGKYKGLLHGIPYGAKDLFAVKGYPTTWGAMPYKDQMLDHDATVVQKLDQAGAILIAKMTMGALARGDIWFGGKTRNPWNLEQGSSGSSAGSASAVAAGLLPFALGTETMGSIVSPSTRCGATGLRPTYGRVSRNGAMALSWTMDKVGPICRSVEDCAIVFEAIRGADGKDPTLIDAAFNYDDRMDPRKLKVGYLKSAFEGDYAFKSQDSLTLETMKKLGFELVPIELPESANLRPVLIAESAAAFDELTRSNRDELLTRQDANSWPVTFRTARFIPAVEYIQASRLRTKLIAEMNEVMQGIDVYLNPSWNGSSLRITNYTGHPCVVVPNGFIEGSPTSITFTGSLFGEAELLKVAKAFQDATAFHQKHPEMFK